MDRRQVGALLAYADQLDPTRAPIDEHAARERFIQWHDLLTDVPATAPHPEGRDWDAAHAVRHHIATSPYPIKPSDVSRPWAAFKADILRRHVDPVPDADPDDEQAYRTAIADYRRAVEQGATVATPRAALDAADPSPTIAARLKAIGRPIPHDAAQALAPYRPRRATREHLTRTGQPDPYTVPCPWCRARVGQPCRTHRRAPRATPHPSRITNTTKEPTWQAKPPSPSSATS